MADLFLQALPTIASGVGGVMDVIGKLFGKKNKTQNVKPTYSETPWAPQYQSLIDSIGSNLPGLQSQINNLANSNGMNPLQASQNFLSTTPGLAGAGISMANQLTDAYRPLMQEGVDRGMANSANSFGQGTYYSGAMMQALANAAAQSGQQFAGKMADTASGYTSNMLNSTAQYFDPRNSAATLQALLSGYGDQANLLAQLNQGRYVQNTQMAGPTQTNGQKAGQSLVGYGNLANPTGTSNDAFAKILSKIFGDGVTPNGNTPQGTANYADIFNPTSSANLANLLSGLTNRA
jgi:hypothetical protein